MSTSAPAVPSKPKTSGLAIASLVCGLVGPCTLGLASIVGIILGIMASKKIKASAGAIGGRGMAMAGIIVSVLTLIIGLALAALLVGGVFVGLTGAMDIAGQAQSSANLHQLCMAANTYAIDQKGRFPPADTWPEVLQKYLGGNEILTRPGKEDAGRAFAMNAKLGGLSMGQVQLPGQTVLFFECSPGAPPSGGRSDLPPEPPHKGGWLIGFCDGHVELVPLNRRDQLIWTPKAE